MTDSSVFIGPHRPIGPGLLGCYHSILPERQTKVHPA
jgi:hypothetical protein